MTNHYNQLQTLVNKISHIRDIQNDDHFSGPCALCVANAKMPYECVSSGEFAVNLRATDHLLAHTRHTWSVIAKSPVEPLGPIAMSQFHYDGFSRVFAPWLTRVEVVPDRADTEVSVSPVELQLFLAVLKQWFGNLTSKAASPGAFIVIDGDIPEFIDQVATHDLPFGIMVATMDAMGSMVSSYDHPDYHLVPVTSGHRRAIYFAIAKAHECLASYSAARFVPTGYCLNVSDDYFLLEHVAPVAIVPQSPGFDLLDYDQVHGKLGYVEVPLVREDSTEYMHVDITFVPECAQDLELMFLRQFVPAYAAYLRVRVAAGYQMDDLMLASVPFVLTVYRMLRHFDPDDDLKREFLTGAIVLLENFSTHALSDVLRTASMITLRAGFEHDRAAMLLLAKLLSRRMACMDDAFYLLCAYFDMRAQAKQFPTMMRRTLTRVFRAMYNLQHPHQRKLFGYVYAVDDTDKLSWRTYLVMLSWALNVMRAVHLLSVPYYMKYVSMLAVPPTDAIAQMVAEMFVSTRMGTAYMSVSNAAYGTAYAYLNWFKPIYHFEVLCTTLFVPTLSRDLRDKCDFPSYMFRAFVSPLGPVIHVHDNVNIYRYRDTHDCAYYFRSVHPSRIAQAVCMTT